jgi:hypothetical protein
MASMRTYFAEVATVALESRPSAKSCSPSVWTNHTNTHIGRPLGRIGHPDG